MATSPHSPGDASTQEHCQGGDGTEARASLVLDVAEWLGSVTEAARVACSIVRTTLPEAESVEIKRTDGGAVRAYLAWRWQPHGGRMLLLRCWLCQKPRRALYGFRVGNDGRYYKAVRADWECRTCAMLRYSSEGSALLIRGGMLSRILGRPFPDVSSPRPEPWLPYVFTSFEQAMEAVG